MEAADTTPHAPALVSRPGGDFARARSASIGIVVCIPCFRRPQHLRQTLELLANSAHRPSLCRGHGRERRAAAARAFRSPPNSWRPANFPGLRGRAAAGQLPRDQRRVRDRAARPFRRRQSFLMIDDDEIASPDWLERMLRAAEATGADIVGGPVLPHFDDAAETRACAVIRHSRRPMTDFRPGAGDLWQRQLPDQARGVRARRSRVRSALQFPSAAATPISSTAAARLGMQLPLGRRGPHQRDGAAGAGPN